MKKTLILLAAVCTLAMVGCSKKKDCNCTVTQNIPGSDPVVTNVTYTAEDGDCSDLNATQTVSSPYGGTMTQVVKCD